MKGRTLYTPGLSGQMNMAIDQYFLSKTEAGSSELVVRFYNWSPWTLSLGNAQKPERELNLALIKEKGFGVVKRMTGGRVVFHSEELTYSVIGPNQGFPWSRSLASTYEKINLALQRGLADAGYLLELERGDSSVPFEKDKVQKPCFASTSKSELVYQGKKVVGSAQRRLRNSFIQHGSILTGPEHLQVGHFLNRVDPGKYRSFVEKNAVSLDQVGSKPEEGVLVNSLAKAFVEELEIPFSQRELTKLERGEAEELAPKFFVL